MLAPGAACAGRPYFISSGDPRPVRDVVNAILAAGGLPPEHRSVPLPVAEAAGAAAEALWRLLRRQDDPPMTRFLARQLATAHWFDLTAARRDLGYEPVVGLDEGFRRLASSRAPDPAPVSRVRLVPVSGARAALDRADLLGSGDIPPLVNRSAAGAPLLAGLLAGAGVLHLVWPGPFETIVPGFLPAARRSSSAGSPSSPVRPP